MKKRSVSFRLLFVGCLILFGCSNVWGADPIRIGVIGPMKFLQGQGHWNGAIMAAEEINAEGGIKVGRQKRPVRLFRADSNEFLSIADAKRAMEVLMSQFNVHFVVGGFRSEAVLAMQDIAKPMNYMIFKDDLRTLGWGLGKDKHLCPRCKDYKLFRQPITINKKGESRIS